MPKSEMVHVRVPSGVKEKAAAAFDEMGVPMSIVVRYLLNFVAKQRALPFRIELPNADTVAAMAEARGGGLKSFASVDELMAELNAPD